MVVLMGLIVIQWDFNGILMGLIVSDVFPEKKSVRREDLRSSMGTFFLNVAGMILLAHKGSKREQMRCASFCEALV